MINQKGGCGKSSTCFHLSGYFAKAGYKVLLVDADPQGSLSQGFFGSTFVEGLECGVTLSAVFDEGSFLNSLDELISATPFPNIDIVRTNQSLAKFNVPEPENSGLSQFAMQSIFDELDGYDVVLIDCPPNLYQCSWNAMLASDYVVIPLPPEDFGTQGLRTVHQAVNRARQLNPRLQLLGQVITRYDRRLVVHRAYDKKLRQVYGSGIFRTTVPEAAAFKVALACRKPVPLYSNWCKATKQTRLLGQELMHRIRESTQNAQEVA